MAKEPNWTIAEDQLLEKYYGTLTAKAIFEQNLIPGRSWTGIRGRAKGLKLRSNLRRLTHSFDETFWRTPNMTNAYWAGMFAADGAMMKLHGKNITYVLQLALSTKDISHLYRFKETVKYTGEIKTYDTFCSISKYKTPVQMSYIRLCQMWKCEPELREIWGIVPNKTKRVAPPVISNHVLQLCYLVGYIDGDGAITADYNKGLPQILISSSSKTIIDWFETIANELLQPSLRDRKVRGSLIVKPTDSPCWRFAVSSYRAARIIDILSRLPLPTLDRKWKNPHILAMVAAYKEKYAAEWAIRLPIEDEIDAYLASLTPPVPIAA